MRDLELRGAGDLLGEEQSGHVAAIGFELYLSMLEEATEALREGREELEERPEAHVRVDVDVSAYIPSEFIPYEAAKIELHRRIAACTDASELRALREELRDRFGPVPQAVLALLELQRARIEAGAAGARTVEVRSGRLSISPLELDSGRVAAIRERVPEALYETSKRTLSVRVPEEPEARLAATLALVDALRAEPALSESR
jgi:transcription-repair coupling factor (superfamily II helicase)